MFFKKSKLKEDKLKEGSFRAEYETCLNLKEVFADKKLIKDKAVFVNLGAGGDIINPLLISGALIDAKEIEFLFYDPRFYYQFIIDSLNDVVENFKYKLKLDGKTASIKFKINKTKYHVYYVGADAFYTIPDEVKKGFDVYYERAFRLFRDSQDLYMLMLFERMNKDGLAITDWGFNKPVLEKAKMEKLDNIPKDFGIYHNLSIYKKL